MDNRPIGVFDSGVGGLTVLKRLVELMPEEDFIYLGDTEKVPYGTRPKEEIVKYSLDCANFLKSKDVKMIVIACNTASTVASKEIAKKHPETDVIELIRPASIAAVRASKNGNIGIIATEATIKNEAYLRNIKLLEQVEHVKIYRQACPIFVEVVENNQINSDKAKDAAKKYILPLVNKNIDTLILGCTHFPYLRNLIAQFAPDVKFVDPGKSASLRAYQRLIDNHKVNDKHVDGNLSFYASSYSENFKKAVLKQLGFEPDKIQLVNIH